MKSKKAFTLLELLVAMAVIAVLISLAVYGILQVQKNSRETQRRKALEDINIGINEYYSLYGEYPTDIVFNIDEAEITDTFGNTVTIPLKNSAKSSSTNTTTVNSTQYEFELMGDGYRLAFCREDGRIENGGTSIDEYDNTICR